MKFINVVIELFSNDIMSLETEHIKKKLKLILMLWNKNIFMNITVLWRNVKLKPSKYILNAFTCHLFYNTKNSTLLHLRVIFRKMSSWFSKFCNSSRTAEPCLTKFISISFLISQTCQRFFSQIWWIKNVLK